MKIINFSVTTVANWMVYFYYMKTQCINSNCSYLMHPREALLSRGIRKATPPFRSDAFASILYGLRSDFFLLLCWFLPHTPSWDENRNSSKHSQWLCRFDSNFSQVNAIILRNGKMLLSANSDKLHWHNIDWWYKETSLLKIFISFLRLNNKIQ